MNILFIKKATRIVGIIVPKWDKHNSSPVADCNIIPVGDCRRDASRAWTLSRYLRNNSDLLSVATEYDSPIQLNLEKAKTYREQTCSIGENIISPA